jgi:pellino protein
LVVVETVKGPDGKRTYRSNSTVSRYACRIQCERSPPYSARLFAAAFDTSGKIKLSSMAPSWQNRSGEYDGITTNGVAFMRPVGVFESGVSPGEWREVTVSGHVRRMREMRSARSPGDEIPEETNILTDGCLIDLCGVTLMWRTAIGLEQGPSNTILRSHRQELNEKAPQCPVNLLTLHFRGAHSRASAESSLDSEDREPWVYLKCGHLHSYHQWKAEPKESDSKRTCPVCREAGPYVRLELGQDRAFFIDSGPLSHAFVPCGHVTTERTIK